MKASKQFLQKNNIPESHPDFVALTEMLSNNTGYMLMFTKFRFAEQVSLLNLRGLFTQLRDNRQILSDLPKPAANYTNYSDLLFDLRTVKAKSSIKQFIQVCPSELKNIIRSHEGRWGEIQQACVRFNELEPIKRKTFVKTISRHKSFNAVSDALHSFIQYVNAGWDMFTVVDKAKKYPNCHIRFVDLEKNIVLLRVTTKKAVVQMGAGSGWCIADSHLQNFQTYVPHNEAIQYIIFDYNYNNNHPWHRVAMTNRGGNITNIHDNRNGALRFDNYIRDNKHLTADMFSGYNEDAEAENILDTIGKGNATPAQIERLAQLGHIDKVINTKLNASKAIKLYGPIINSTATSAEQTRLIAKTILPIVESTKFFNVCIPSLHKLDVETTNDLITSGLSIKYGVHLDEIITTYYNGAKAITEEAVIEIDGVMYNKVVTLTPLNHLKLEVFDAILSTNPEIVTNKSLTMANEFDNLPLFKVLLKHFKNKKNNKVRKAHDFKQDFYNEIRNEGLL